MRDLLKLYLIFAKIGGFTFGGGYAMLPILQREIVEKYHWATEDELLDYFAIGQCTPGIIAVNTATFIGTKVKGVIGGIVATLGLITPSLIIITIIAAFLKRFADYEIVQHAFSGIRAAVCALVLVASFKIAKKSLVDIFTVIIFIAVTLLSIFTSLTPAVYVVLAGICGIIIKLSHQKMKGGTEEETK